MKNIKIIAEIAGWYGAAAILSAYTLVSFDIVAGDGLVFQLLNLTGAVGIMVIAIYKKVLQSVVLNIIWSAIAIVAIIAILA
jgi:hypothetical protein